MKSTVRLSVSIFVFNLVLAVLPLYTQPVIGEYNIHDFDSIGGSSPAGSMVMLDSDLFGATENGGANDCGIIFRIKKDGSGFAKLFDFIDSTGCEPQYGLISGNGWLFGTTSSGGLDSAGTVFKIRLDGNDFTLLNAFNDSNGRHPLNLVLSGNYLYGATKSGGSSDFGVIYKVKTDNEPSYAAANSLADTLQKLITDGTVDADDPLTDPTIIGFLTALSLYQPGMTNAQAEATLRAYGRIGFEVLHEFDFDKSFCNLIFRIPGYTA